MADIGMGSNLPKQLQDLSKPKETDNTGRVDRRDNTRETMAGSKQVSEKYRKEDLPKSEDRFKAYQRAAKYLLAEEDDDVDEELHSGSIADPEEIEDNEEVNKTLKPTLDEIEDYQDLRSRFKAKIFYHLGENFSEELPEPEDNEDEFTTEEKKQDLLDRIDLANKAFSSLQAYLAESLGSFDFDRVSDLQRLTKYGMPEDAMLRLLILQQLARGDIFFPDQLDFCLLSGKCKSLGIPKTEDFFQEFIKKDFGSLEKLRYTISGFIYIPLQEIINLIQEDLKNEYKSNFQKILGKYDLEDFSDFKTRLPRSLLVEIKEMITNSQLEVEKRLNEYLTENKKINPLKPNEQLNLTIKEIELKLKKEEKKLVELEKDLSKMIFIYSFLNSEKSIADFNKNFPLEQIIYTLDLLRVRTREKKIRELIYKKVDYYFFIEEQIENKKEMVTNIETYEARTKAAIIAIKNQQPAKQQQLIKNLRSVDQDLGNSFYWLKQKNCQELISAIESKDLI